MKMSASTVVRMAVATVSVFLGVAESAVAGAPWTAAPMDWPYWRGPEMNGISREQNIVDSWSPRGENLLWKREDLASRSTPIVVNGRLYAICRDNPGTNLEGEKCVCVDAATGETIWESRWNAYLTDVPDTRLGWSSVTGDPTSGNVFTLGVSGYFQCIDENGETLWDHSMSEEYGLLSTYGGRTNFPIVFENLVIASGVIIGWGDMAKPTHRYIAFDKRTGEVVWFEGTRPFPEDTTYSAPVLAVIDGQAQLIFGAGDGSIYGFQPRTGKKLWSYNASMRGVNTSPVVAGNIVICGHSEENLDTTKMGALFAIDATKTGDLTKSGEVWRHPEWFVGKSSPIVVDGRVYAAQDTGTLVVADAKTGEQIASHKLRGPMRASPLYVDGKVYACTENGIWWTLRPTGDGVEEVYRARLPVGEVNASPIVSHGRMYVSTSQALYCIGKAGQDPAAEPRPEALPENPKEDDPTPALVQVAPAESLLRPGARQKFQVRLYNKNGQFLKMADDNAKVALNGPGSIDDDGKFSNRDADRHSATIITAEVEGLKGTARARVVPNLPWSFDFSQGEIPITWVGIRYRHIPVDFALLKSLQERNPLAGRLYIYLTTDFVNTAQRKQVYDDSNPRMRWTELLRCVDLQDNAAVLHTVEGAKSALEPGLAELKQESVIESWSWSEWTRQGASGPSGPQFTVFQGSRGVDPENAAMMKITTIPKGTRSQGWFGPTRFSNYTVQADVYSEDSGRLPAADKRTATDADQEESLAAVEQGTPVANKGRLPDIGIIGQRYTLDLKGAYQQLQIRTWPPQLRMAKTIPFEWEANVWYTMKLRAAVEDGKAVLRGKVWRRDEPEPDKWLLEAVDESPNLIGSPGLYADAKNAEVIYDNIKVSEN